VHEFSRAKTMSIGQGVLSLLCEHFGSSLVMPIKATLTGGEVNPGSAWENMFAKSR